MGLFNFKKKSAEEQYREKIREVFESSVKEVVPQLSGNDLIDSLMIQAAIGSARETLLSSELQIIGLIMTNDLTPEQIIDEECNRVLNKYLVR